MSLGRKFLYLLDGGQRYRLLLLVAMSSVGAALEGVGLGLVMPFIGVINDPAIVRTSPWLAWMARTFGATSHYQLVLWSGVALLIGYVVKNGYLACMYCIEYRLLYRCEAALAQRLFRAYLGSPYLFQLRRDPAEMLKNIRIEVPLIFNQVVIPVFTVVSEAMVGLVIVGVLLLIEPVPALVAAGILGGVTAGFYRAVRHKIGELGEQEQHYRTAMFQWISRGLSGFKEITVLGRQRFFLDAFAKNSAAYARAATFFQATGQMPRLFIETIAVAAVMLIVVMMLAQGRRLDGVLPILAVFAAAALRLIPSLSRGVHAFSTIRYYRPAIGVVYDDLSVLEAQRAQVVASSEAPMHFERAIELRNVAYDYPGGGPVLRDVSLAIPKGRSVALVGPSGAGKTTVVDLIIGLLQPTTGEVTVDGRSLEGRLGAWQRQIGYVPQAIYLSDDTIRHNVAFGIPDAEIDDARVWSVLKLAQMAEFVDGLPKGLDTSVGERGARLSGGERHRLGIARALYHSPAVLVMDEATAALDSETEAAVTGAIERLSGTMTIIVIAHRASTVAKCDITLMLPEPAGSIHKVSA
jgi:ABC-type multidrug transport system fused ATPase/permease subunit